MSSETELAWAAGFFDGEGCASTQPANRRLYWRLDVSQTDRRPLERFQRAVGCGRIEGPYRRTGRPLFCWRSSRQTECPQVMENLWPYLSEPKRSQWLAAKKRVEQSLVGWVARPPGRVGFKHSEETKRRISVARRAYLERQKAKA